MPNWIITIFYKATDAFFDLLRKLKLWPEPAPDDTDRDGQFG